MKNSAFAAAAVVVLFVFASSLSAQSTPHDSDAWRDRCASLANSGGVPPPDGSGMPAARLEVLARQFSAQGQHFVACTLFMEAAGGETAAGKGQQSRTDVAVARAEQKLGLGQKLSFLEKLTRSSDIVANSSAPNYTPNPMELWALNNMVQPGAGGAPPAAAGTYAPPAGNAARADEGRPAQSSEQPAYAAQPTANTAPAPQAVAAPAGQGLYVPLPNNQVADSGTGRVQWVQQHPSSGGTPAVCRSDWSGSGRISNDCGNALFDQAEAERKAGNCVAAMTDYDNARQAAQNGGQIIIMNMREGDGRTFCANKLNPPKPAAPVRYAAGGVLPIGRYTCYTAPAVIANGGAYGVTAVQLGQWEGYMWVFDSHRYAGASIENTGTYTLHGNDFIPETGPYKRIRTKMTFAAHGSFNRPTMYLTYLSDAGAPEAGMGCTYDGPPAQ